MRRARRERGVHWRRAATACALVLGLGVGSAQGQLHPKPGREPIISRLDPRFDALVPPAARLDRIVDDHGWVEGPVWVRDGGYLLFSDVVKNAIYRWKDGEAVIFDDAFEHEAWNRTPHTRVVLFVDFRKPLRFPANVLNWLLLNLAVFTPFIREGMDNQKAWEKRFYAEAEALRNR